VEFPSKALPAAGRRAGVEFVEKEKQDQRFPTTLTPSSRLVGRASGGSGY